jgi:ABC-type sugar transport system ATPase subunit
VLRWRQSVVLGVRPEHVRLTRQLESGWPAQISLIELHGGQSYLELDIGGIALTAVAPADMEYRLGQDVWIELPVPRLHLFDSRTGDRLALPPQD